MINYHEDNAQSVLIANNTQSILTADRTSVTALCQCGCGDSTRGGKYLPGHGARHQSYLNKESLRGCEKSQAILISKGWGPPTLNKKKSKKKIQPCECGCNGVTRGGRYQPGHDARHKSDLIQRSLAGDLSAVDELGARGWGKFLSAKVTAGPKKEIKAVLLVTPISSSPVRIEVQPGDPRVMTPKQVLEIGMEVVQKACDWFMNTNRAHYAAVGFDDSDMLGHLHEHIFVKRILPFFTKHPDYYLNGPIPSGNALLSWKKAHYSIMKGTKTAIDIFKSSLFVSCRRCCFAHHRAQIRSQCRGNALKYGMVSLDHQEFDFEGHVKERALFGSYSHDLDSGFQREVEYHLTSPNEQRVWICLYRDRPDLLAKLPISQSNKDDVIQKIRQLAHLHIDNPEPQKTSIMDPAVKARLKAAAQKALSTGAIQFQETKAASQTAAHQLIAKLGSTPDHKIREMLEFLNSNSDSLTSIPTTPQQAKVRAQAIKDSVTTWLAVDYELVSEALDIEINNEMSPMVTRVVLSDRLQNMTIDEREKIPQFIWDFVQSMDVNAAPLNTQPDFDPYAVQQGDDLETIKIIPLGSSVSGFMNQIRNRVKWVVWMEGQQVSISHEEGNVYLRCHNFQYFSIDQIKKMLSSFDV